MKRIAVFCIPAHGHTNPILPVVTELVRRGDIVRFYSFEDFADKIRATGAEYVSCDRFLGELTAEQESKLKKVSVTEMTIQDLRITMNMNDFLTEEFDSFKPDVVYTDSACFWGKLNAMKYNVPMVVSTSTFAFNQMSSTYMKNSLAETADLVLGLPKMQKELKKLEPYGYRVKSFLSLVQSDNDTDSVVYTSKRMQPYSESFSDRYLFAGPSVFSDKVPDKNAERPLVYISMGTVINDRPDFYKKCIEALKSQPVDVIISCGRTVDISTLGELPTNVKVYPYVDQLDVLSRASVFVTHCGMNSVSESLYMAAPMVLYPQTAEQFAVARRAAELRAGVILKDDSADGIGREMKRILDDGSFAKAAQECCDDLRSCGGASAAADFIERAPHISEDDMDVLKELGKVNVISQVGYSFAALGIGKLLFAFVSVKLLPLYIVAAVVLSAPVNKLVQKLNYKRLIKKKAALAAI